MARLVLGTNKTVAVPVIAKEIEKLPALGLLRAKDANGKLIPSTTESQIMDFTGVTDVDAYMLAYAYYNNTEISGAVDFDSLTTVSGSYACANMFYHCTGLTRVNLSSLTTLSGGNACYSMFAYCTGLTSIDLSSLATISGNVACSSMFYHCTGLTSVDLSSLTTVSGNNACSGMFNACTSLSTVYIGGITAIDFGTRTNQFTSIFSGCTQNIDVYAPAASQSTIEAMSGYPNFGGTGTVTWHWNTAE